MLTTIKDYEEIRKVAQMQVDGCNSDSSVMKPAFHKNATINGEPIQVLFDGVDKAGKADSKAEIDILDVFNDIASIRITLENYHGENFVDFHLLKKDKDGWKIMAKIFTETK